MDPLETRLKTALANYIGYPCNSSYDYSSVAKYSSIHINNVGDPNVTGTYHANTKDIEKEVLAFFADLWGIDKSNTWGYITNAGTEGNLQGLYVARESASVNGGDSTGQRPHVFLTSTNSHYSIFKIARLLQLNLVKVNSQECGEIDYIDFERHVAMHQDKYIIVNANLGTTMKGALDNTREIFRILKKYKKHNDSYIHMDGALTGFYLPFIEKDLLFKAHINSMSISGHKWLGVPFPCGIFIMEKRFLERVSNNVEYIGSNDCMISGSRNGHAPIFLHHIITHKTYEGFQADIKQCIDLAEYLVDHVEGAWRNHNSVTVVIPRPSESIIQKWQLATEGDISHVVCMPHVTKEKLDEFIKDLSNTPI